MQIFDCEIHQITRASAAVFALYIMYRVRKVSDPLFLGALIMLGFDVYTWNHTECEYDNDSDSDRTPPKKRPRYDPSSDRRCDKALTIIQGAPNCWVITSYTLAMRVLWDELPSEMREHIQQYLDGPNAKQGLCLPIPESVKEAYKEAVKCMAPPPQETKKVLDDPTQGTGGGVTAYLMAALIYMAGYKDTVCSKWLWIPQTEDGRTLVDPLPGVIPYPRKPRQLIQVNYTKRIYRTSALLDDIEHLLDRTEEHPYGIDGGWVRITGPQTAHAIPFTICRTSTYDDAGKFRNWQMVLCNQHDGNCIGDVLNQYLGTREHGTHVTRMYLLAGKNIETLQREPYVP